ncbi:hypothetical protein C9I43_17310 [Shewanella morhuae]|uniref:Protein of uncharacterized function (DUF2726) n=1 Tax=Shewanella morhuae TaxID=365591 RepID=A0A380AST2_9GAMM|nr:DUF2726 domain-containing protein [Shewanella morhuae]PTA48821.1 hypothetical protein C9I43_17310 [Shewanella morhuae]GIU13604.1 hypothetical protein TUM4641_33490 [Shewanella morhuae]SUI86365.1 Protein of uncharacterised function (DUF2726) [Shewanella morhuae]
MNTSVILSYAFMYFVLFVAVPFVFVMFVMTCIKFFKSGSDEAEHHEIKLKPMLFDKKSFSFFKSLKTVVEGKYDVFCNVPLDTVFEMDQHDASLNHDYRLDYVLIDQDSSEVKMVISDSSKENNSLMKKLFSKFNINFIEMNQQKSWDAQSLKQALAV